ncbi:MAG: hypothetical protein WEA61_01325 [Anaerolineales bacterium]
MKSYATQRGNLIDRYIAEVGRRLPQKQRADVQLELRSALQDALDERGLDADKKKDEAKVAALLKKWGKPSTVAESFGARNFLIGPELMPYYWLVLRFAIFIGILVQLVLMAVAAFNQADFEVLVRGTVSNLIDGALTSFAMVTLVFAVLDKTMAGELRPQKEWDPRTLPEPTVAHDRIDTVGTLIEIFISGAFILAVNLAPGWLAAAPQSEGWDLAGALFAKFAPFIPWLTAVWVGQLALKVYLLVRGRWERWMRGIEFVLAVAGVVVLAAIYKSAPFSDVAMVDSIVKFSIGIAVIIASIDAAVKLFRILRPDWRFPWQEKQFEQAVEDLGQDAEAIGKALEARFKKAGRGRGR